MSVKTVAIIQARMGSTRLPGKVLSDIGGKPALTRMIERIRPATSLDAIVIATTDQPVDDPVVELCRSLGLPCFRGDEQDVLGRYMGAARFSQADVVLRLTADCPMHDPAIIDEAVALFRDGDYDYLSNAAERTYPDGLDVEVMSRATLERADKEARHPFLREHVTAYIRGSRPEYGSGQFRIGHMLNDTDLSAVRWTVDYPEDLEKVRYFFAHLPEGFGWRQAMELERQLTQDKP